MFEPLDLIQSRKKQTSDRKKVLRFKSHNVEFCENVVEDVGAETEWF